MTSFNEEMVSKWKPVLEHPELPAIKDSHKRHVIAQLLENTEKSMRESGGMSPQALLEVATNSVGTGGYTGAASATGGVAGYDPILISLIRRAMPNLVAYDICGVQPMTGPTGLIFAMRSQYANSTSRTTTNGEAFYDEALTSFSTVRSGANTIGNAHTGTTPALGADAYNFAGGANTATAEALGVAADSFPEMAFTIDKVSVTARSRALKAEYTIELAQDLKAVHGLDAETELANILQSEILAEINREVVRTINLSARAGAQDSSTTTAGTFDLDTDSNGRWSVEKFKGLMFHMEREANKIAKDTRRGKGNMVIVSTDVASALAMTGLLDYNSALSGQTNLAVDDTGNTFAGTLFGRIKVYVDPYSVSGTDYVVVGYKGTNAYDAGLFYCPYVPLQMVRAVDPQTYQPKVGFKTRYGLVANPFATSAGTGALANNTNYYYRKFQVLNINQ